jgi:hypothetical protein
MLQNKTLPFTFLASHLKIHDTPYYRRRLSLESKRGPSKKHGHPSPPSSLDGAGLSARFDSPVPGYCVGQNGELDSRGLLVIDR